MSDYLVPEGSYQAVATTLADDEGNDAMIRWGKSTTGTKTVLVYFEIIEGEYAGRVLPWFGYFKSKDGSKRTVKSLRYAGFKGDDISNPGKLDQVVSVSVEHNSPPDSDKTYARIAWVNQSGGGTAMALSNPMSQDEIRNFASMVMDSVKGIPEVAGEQRAAKPANEGSNGKSDRGFGDLGDSAPSGGGWPEEPEAQNDDIPF